MDPHDAISELTARMDEASSQSSIHLEPLTVYEARILYHAAILGIRFANPKGPPKEFPIELVLLKMATVGTPDSFCTLLDKLKNLSDLATIVAESSVDSADTLKILRDTLLEGK